MKQQQQQHQYITNYTISTDDDTEDDEIRLWNLDEKIKSECYNSLFQLLSYFLLPLFQSIE